MQRWKLTVAMTAMILLVSGASLIAQGRGGSKPPKPQPAPKGVSSAPKASQTTKVGGAKATRAPAPASVKTQKATTTKSVRSGTGKPSGKMADSKVAKPKAPAGSKKTADVARANGAASKKSAATTTTAAGDTGATTAGGTGTGTTATPTLTPVQQKLQKNTNLAGKLQSRLPAGTDLMDAAADFRNLGQFVAAVNVSNNLGIDFAMLKTKMVDDGLSLGASIQALKPTASGTVEAQRAEYDARGMILESEQTQVTASTTVTTTTRKKKGKSSGGSK
jgi:hypothetical protein